MSKLADQILNEAPKGGSHPAYEDPGFVRVIDSIGDAHSKLVAAIKGNDPIRAKPILRSLMHDAKTAYEDL